MTSAPDGGGSRPREVTFGGLQALVGGVLATVLLIGTARQLYSSEMRDVLVQALDDPRASQLGITVDAARTMARYAIMVMGVLSVASVILAVFVLRRHRPSRIALTVLGAVVGLVTVFAGPGGWAVTLYIAVSIAMLWSRPARAWFAEPKVPAGTWPPQGFADPSGPPPPPPPPPPPARQ